MSPRLALILGVIAIAGAAAYLILRPRPGGESALDTAPRERATAPLPSARAEAASSRTVTPPSAPAKPDTDEKLEPHPVTSARIMDAEQHALFRALEHALAHRDFTRAHALVREHERRFSGVDGWQDDRRAYEHALDCLEHPGAESRARGERFIELNRASTLRRHVREACFGPREPVLLPPAR